MFIFDKTNCERIIGVLAPSASSGPQNRMFTLVVHFAPTDSAVEVYFIRQSGHSGFLQIDVVLNVYSFSIFAFNVFLNIFREVMFLVASGKLFHICGYVCLGRFAENLVLGAVRYIAPCLV